MGVDKDCIQLPQTCKFCFQTCTLLEVLLLNLLNTLNNIKYASLTVLLSIGISGVLWTVRSVAVDRS